MCLHLSVSTGGWDLPTDLSLKPWRWERLKPYKVGSAAIVCTNLRPKLEELLRAKWCVSTLMNLYYAMIQWYNMITNHDMLLGYTIWLPFKNLDSDSNAVLDGSVHDCDRASQPAKVMGKKLQKLTCYKKLNITWVLCPLRTCLVFSLSLLTWVSLTNRSSWEGSKGI